MGDADLQALLAEVADSDEDESQLASYTEPESGEDSGSDKDGSLDLDQLCPDNGGKTVQTLASAKAAPLPPLEASAPCAHPEALSEHTENKKPQPQPNNAVSKAIDDHEASAPCAHPEVPSEQEEHEEHKEPQPQPKDAVSKALDDHEDSSASVANVDKDLHHEKSAEEDQSQLSEQTKIQSGSVPDLESLSRLAEGRSHLSLQDLQLVSLDPGRSGAKVFPKSLTSLCLSGNAFSDVAELSSQLARLVSLVELDLSRCKLTHLPEFPRLQCLSDLNLSGNDLMSSRGLARCSGLRRLSLARNRLRTTEQLEMLLQLEELDLSHNQLGAKSVAKMKCSSKQEALKSSASKCGVAAEASLRPVAACTKLRALWVQGNPFAADGSHRPRLASLFPSLVLLDERLVRPQRVAAARNGTEDETGAKGRGTLGYGLLARGWPTQQKEKGSDAVKDQSQNGCSHGNSSVSSSGRQHLNSAGRSKVPASPQRPPMYLRPTKASLAQVVHRTSSEQDLAAVDRPVHCLSSPSPGPRRSPAAAMARSSSVGALSAGFAPLPRRKASKADTRRCSPMRSGLQEMRPSPARAAPVWRPASPQELSRGHHGPSGGGLSRASPTKKRSMSPQGRGSSAMAWVPPLPVYHGNHSKISGNSAAKADTADVEASLTSLLEEKRRLLQRVSGKIGKGVVNAVLGCNGPCMSSSLVLSEGHANQSVTASGMEASPIISHSLMSSASLNQGEGNLDDSMSEASDLRSLCDSLRGGIERKRVLLQQLQQC
eukprot:TRINITY_DN15867_c0_g1_i1.p1 TRINITY_DN15867_c0_g1~~TRINITY_DN15867_c0_g1_i1.p1  ORF type:complete len:770 (+),score=148.25 TRINITY_DN15867_c0_g1_i1:176-2485(+)